MTELLPAVQAAYQDLDKAPLDLRRQDRFSDLCIDMFLDGNPMSKMSHAAQAVLFAAWQDIDYAPIRNVHGSAAAVLRAASARVLHLCEDSVNSKFLEGIEASADLLDQIANELEPLEYPFCQRVRAALAQPEPEPPTFPADSLVGRVAIAIAAADDEGLTNMTWNYHARAAILEVATWMVE